MIRLLTLGVLGGTALVGSCRVEESATPGTRAAQLLEAEIVKGRAPAVQYRFVGPDSVIFRFDAGRADVDRALPVSATTTFHGFSITKTVTAVAILQLVERGLLELDRPAAGYLPSFPYSGEITVRQLLTHTAGLPNPVPLRWVHLAQDHEHFDADGFFREVFARNSTLRSAPNVRFRYSNLGYVLLGQIIESVSGLSYEGYVMERILAPIGLSPGELGFEIDDARHARGYHRRWSLSYHVLGLFLDAATLLDTRVEGWRAFRPYYVNGAAYGGLVGTADGFARYLQALLDPEGGLLQPQSRELLFTENVLAGGQASGMAMSWFLGRMEGATFYDHAGGGGGYYAELRIYPELQRGSVILFNRSGMTNRRFLDRVDRFLIGGTETLSREAL